MTVAMVIIILYCHALQGTLSARGERILMVDGDGATAIADIEKLEVAMDKMAKDHVG